jgi:hypothetical protein
MAAMATGPDRAELVRAFEAARAADDVEAMAAAALRMASERRFGAPLGGAPGYLHEAYVRAVGPQRVRLAVELARAWVYAGEAARAVPFAQEALTGAEGLADPTLLAAALDADLLVHWGPDDLAARLAATTRLDEVAAHLTDVETRLSASLWRLTTAIESVDPVAMQRQLRLLDDLWLESGSARVRMFAASRRGMYALLVGDLDSARRAAVQVDQFGTAAAEPDTEALVHVLVSAVARQAGDVDTLVAEASAYESFGIAHGVRSILAEAALLWLEAGSQDRAGVLIGQAVAGGVESLPRDVDWLLTLTTAVEISARTGAGDVVERGLALLTPYAGRAVVNAGGVAFTGVVEDYLRIACTALGRHGEAARWATTAYAAYRRLDAQWWLRRIEAASAASSQAEPVTPVRGQVTPAVLAPDGDGVWLVGIHGRAVTTPAMKGFRYLHLLLERPQVELTALEMAAAVAGHHTQVHQPDLGQVLDRQALAAYKRRITELDDELAETRSWSDQPRTARLAAERSMLLDQIAAATGLGQRYRVTGASAERARVAVQKSIAAAIRRITDLDAGLGRLLRDCIRTGSTCCYQPDPARLVVWTLARSGPAGVADR